MNDHWYMMADADPDRPMTPAQAAEWLQVEESTLRRWASGGGSNGKGWVKPTKQAAMPRKGEL